MLHLQHCLPTLRCAIRALSGVLLAVACAAPQAQAQVAEAFNLCQDMSVAQQDRVAALTDLGFVPANAEQTRILDNAAALDRSLSSDRRMGTPLIPLLEEGRFDEPFEAPPGFSESQTALWHESSMGVLVQHARGPFLTGKIDMVMRGCVIALTRDYTGTTGLFRIPEMPKPFETDFASVIAYVGDRPSPFAREFRGDKSGTFRAHIIAISADAPLGPRWSDLEHVYKVELTDDRNPDTDP